MPARGRHGGEYWTRDHLDTADTLRYIHTQIAANVVPNVEEFLRTPIGRQLVDKWGGGNKGTKKVKYNFSGTLNRYKEWKDTGGGGGDFTREQLSRAGLEIPEGNAARQGGLNTNPGSDSENEELRQRAEENDNIFGGEGGETGTAPAPVDNQPAGAAAGASDTLEIPVPEEAAGESYTTVVMTHTLRLHVVPGFDVENSTKTMFLISLELPGGLVTANPVLDEDLMGATISFVELGQALDAAFLLRDIAAVQGQGHVIGHVREDLEVEMVADETLVRNVDNSMARAVQVSFPEKADTFLFNPATHSRINPLYIRHVPGGRTVVMTAVWQARAIPVFRGVDNAGLSAEEQAARAVMFFPDIQVAGARPVAAANNNNNGGVDAALLRNLNDRMHNQEARIRAEFQARLDADRRNLQARLAGMNGDDIRALGAEEFRELFQELQGEMDGAQHGVRVPAPNNTGGRRAGRGGGNGRDPVVVEDAMDTEF